LADHIEKLQAAVKELEEYKRVADEAAPHANDWWPRA
jgi:hypothetical protein